MRSWSGDLTDWYRANKRVLPWREAPLPYFIWVSEVMLQQTQVETVIDYFNRFIAKFPTVEKLAVADLQEVLKLWEGLGYYSRARNFHKAAQKVVAEYGGEIPSTYLDLQKLPGLGPYAAAAVASLAFSVPVPVVDGNVLRVFARFWGMNDDIRLPKMRQLLFDQLVPIIAEENPSDFNQGMMELGALICRPQSPLCLACPIQPGCVAFRERRTDELPVKSKLPKAPHFEIGVGVIWRGDHILIAKRKTDQMLGGLWEFPGGKRQAGESLEETVCRELLEETGLTVQIGAPYPIVKHAYTHFKITMTAFRCVYLSGKPSPNTSDELKWVPVSDLNSYPFPKASLKVIENF